MRHLTPDEFVDMLESGDAASAPAHLASCAACRKQLDDLRAALTMASGAEVPEPSPLFWDAFSERVRTAIEEDPRPRAQWWTRLALPATALVAAAALVLIVRVSSPRPSTPFAPRQAATSDAPAREALPEIDDSLALVAELAASFDVGEAGLAARGDAEHAVTHLTDGELTELRRLIEQEMNP